MPSVVIAAHNEESMIRACLDALLDQGADDLEIVVSANGCTDRTVELAASVGVTVVERAEPGKAAAINAAEHVATRFPRVYLDADIVLPLGALAAFEAHLARHPGVLAVVPARQLNLAGRPWPVRAYFQINSKVPAFRDGLFGRGCVALSEAGRSRFDLFPELIADDLFLDSQFSADEKAVVSHVTVVVEAPWTTRDLFRRLVRVRRGNAEMRSAAASGELGVRIRSARRWAWLTDVVAKKPILAPAGVVYAALSLAASVRASHAPRRGDEWGRDESTRERASGLQGRP